MEQLDQVGLEASYTFLTLVSYSMPTTFPVLKQLYILVANTAVNAEDSVLVVSQGQTQPELAMGGYSAAGRRCTAAEMWDIDFTPAQVQQYRFSNTD